MLIKRPSPKTWAAANSPSFGLWRRLRSGDTSVMRPLRRLLILFWLPSLLILTVGGYKAAGWLERSEYQSNCSSWWDGRDEYLARQPEYFKLNPQEDPFTGRTRSAYMNECMAKERAAKQRALADPDSGCHWAGDSSGCPPMPDLRIVAGVYGGGRHGMSGMDDVVADPTPAARTRGRVSH